MTDLMNFLDPEVLDAKPPDKERIWKECEEASNHVSNQDGSTNWRAAFSADPGGCSCPACGQYHWKIGYWHRCRNCQFIYHSDSWGMFSWGAQQRRHERGSDYWRELEPGPRQRLEALRDRRLKHPYYKHGYDLNVGDDVDLWQLYHNIDWRAAMQGVTPDFTVGEIY